MLIKTNLSVGLASHSFKLAASVAHLADRLALSLGRCLSQLVQWMLLSPRHL